MRLGPSLRCALTGSDPQQLQAVYGFDIVLAAAESGVSVKVRQAVKARGTGSALAGRVPSLRP